MTTTSKRKRVTLLTTEDGTKELQLALLARRDLLMGLQDTLVAMLANPPQDVVPIQDDYLFEKGRVEARIEVVEQLLLQAGVEIPDRSVDEEQHVASEPGTVTP